MTQFSSAINYYNPEAGEWEPFIETFKIYFSINEDQVNKRRSFQCELPSNILINVTEKLVKNLSDTYKSWQEESNGEGQQDDDPSQSNKLRQESMVLSGDKGGTAKSRPSGYNFDNIDEEEEFEQNQKEEDIVTPYSICNQTAGKLLVKRLTYNQERDSNEKSFRGNKNPQLMSLTVKGGAGSTSSKLNRVYVIHSGEKIDYAVDYEL